MMRFMRGFSIVIKSAGRFNGEYDGAATLRATRKRAREDFASSPELLAVESSEVWIVRFSPNGERRYLIERVTA